MAVFTPSLKKAKRTRALSSAGDALARIFAERGGKGMIRRLALWQQWEEVMGPEFTSLGVPLDCRGTTLVVAAYDSMAMQELKMQADILLDRANDFMKSEAFGKVSFTLVDERTPLNAPAMPKSTGPIVPPPNFTPPQGFGSLQNSLDLDSAVGRCYKALCEAYKLR